jgi:hypothetical protein
VHAAPGDASGPYRAGQRPHRAPRAGYAGGELRARRSRARGGRARGTGWRGEAARAGARASAPLLAAAWATGQ